ncbi:hypothetical protein [Litorisediminicola beolgyonensis]|uniref:Uncharacterized protein n=1 Tax=Litorisediminicola beolgyonensis TaxID=1173614 RepID=A0ABW3ZI56_9RHOB
MSDHVRYLGVLGPPSADAADGVQAACERLQDEGLLGEVSPGAAPGHGRAAAIAPGPRVLQAAPELSGLTRNGVELYPSPFMNVGALMSEGLTCPRCGLAVGPDHDRRGEIVDLLGSAADAERFDDGAALCPACEGASGVNDWVRGEAFILASCGLALWNWPRLPQIDAALCAALADAIPGRPLRWGAWRI